MDLFKLMHTLGPAMEQVGPLLEKLPSQLDMLGTLLREIAENSRATLQIARETQTLVVTLHQMTLPPALTDEIIAASASDPRQNSVVPTRPLIEGGSGGVSYGR